MKRTTSIATLAALILLGAAAPKPTAPVQTLKIPELSASVAADYSRSLKGLWEDLHANPELSFRETRTAGVVARELRAIGGLRV